MADASAPTHRVTHPHSRRGTPSESSPPTVTFRVDSTNGLRCSGSESGVGVRACRRPGSIGVRERAGTLSCRHVRPVAADLPQGSRCSPGCGARRSTRQRRRESRCRCPRPLQTVVRRCPARLPGACRRSGQCQRQREGWGHHPRDGDHHHAPLGFGTEVTRRPTDRPTTSLISSHHQITSRNVKFPAEMHLRFHRLRKPPETMASDLVDAPVQARLPKPKIYVLTRTKG